MSFLFYKQLILLIAGLIIKVSVSYACTPTSVYKYFGLRLNVHYKINLSPNTLFISQIEMMNMNEMERLVELTLSNPSAELKYKVYSLDNAYRNSSYLFYSGIRVQVPVSLTRKKYYLENSLQPVVDLYLQNMFLFRSFGINSIISYQTNHEEIEPTFHAPPSVSLPENPDKILPVFCFNGIVKKTHFQENNQRGFANDKVVYQFNTGLELFIRNVSVGSFYNFSLKTFNNTNTNYISNKITYWF